MDIANILEVQVKEKSEVDSKENVTPREQLPSTTNVNMSLPQEDVEYYKLIFGNDVSMVRFKRLHCTACDVHIGSAPANVHNMFEHPVLFTLLCANCRDFYGDGKFEQGDDATDMFCRWCANGGNLYCCSFCSNTFCSKCISRNFDPVLRKKIEADDKWKCFVCDPKDLFRARATCWALLQHVQKMNRLIQNSTTMTDEQIEEKLNTDETICCVRNKKRKRVRCLSDSEDDDASSVYNSMTTSKRKRRDIRKKYYNGRHMTIDKTLEGTEDYDNNEVLPSLLSCEQTMVEEENVTINPDGAIVPKEMAYQSPVQQQQSRVKVVPSSNLLANPVNVLSRMNSKSQPDQTRYLSYNTSVPMVTIPNKNVRIVSKASTTESQAQCITPNVIEIDSDPEVVPIIDLTQSSLNSSTKPNSAKDDKVKPVALVSWKDEATVWMDMNERAKPKTLSQRLLPHTEHACSVLAALQKKLLSLCNNMRRDQHRHYDANRAERLIKRFHRDIRDAVAQLSDVNDRIVREHSSWEKSQPSKQSESNSTNENDINVVNREWEKLPLEMTCTNDSDSDHAAEEESMIVYPSKMICSTSNVQNRLFNRKITVDRGVDNRVSKADKMIQIFDVELLDYDKCINQSCFNKVQLLAEKYSKTPTYEGQFVQFLRRSMTSSSEITKKVSRKLPDSDETSSMDLTEDQISHETEQSAAPCNNNTDTIVEGNEDLQPIPGTSKATDHVIKANHDTTKNSAANDDKSKQVKMETIKICLPCSNNTSVLESEKHNLNRTEDISEDDCIIINN